MEYAHNAFTCLNYADDVRDNIYKVTASTMHCGNLKFCQKGRDDQAQPDGTEAAGYIAELCGVDTETMLTNYCKPKIKVGAELLVKGQTVEKATDSVGAMAKGMFDRLFTYLVKKCNETLETGLKRVHFIGVLDIAGFEIFDFNGFEQVTITLFEMKMGLWSILEEESMFPKATDKTFQEKLIANHEGKIKPFLKAKGNTHFGIQHYAGIVYYNITGWLEKNKDPLNDTVIDQLKKGSNKLVVRLFADHPGQSFEPEEKKGGKKKTGGFKTVCSAYRDQLGSLMAVLHATHPHFIRCIVPNNTKTPGKVEAGLIMHQLTCNGVLEGIRICQIGLPNRITYPDFMNRYKLLAADIFNSVPDKKKAVAAAFEKIGIEAEKYRVGNTKVFFRAGVLGEVEEIRDDYLGRLIGFLQAQVRGWKSRRWFKKAQTQRVNLIVVQRNLRKYMNIRTWLWYGFWQQLKPKLNVGREQKMLADLEAAAIQAEENVIIANEKNVKFGAENEVLISEKNALLDALEESKGGAAQYLEKEAKLMAQKAEVESQLADAQKRLDNETEAKNALYNGAKKAEAEIGKVKGDLEEMAGKLLAAQQDKETKDAQLKNLGEEIAHQEELISKMAKEKKALFEANQRTAA